MRHEERHADKRATPQQLVMHALMTMPGGRMRPHQIMRAVGITEQELHHGVRALNGTVVLCADGYYEIAGAGQRDD